MSKQSLPTFDAAEAAEAFLRFVQHNGSYVLRRRQQFYVWNGAHYIELSDELLQAAIFRYVRTAFGLSGSPRFVEGATQTAGFLRQLLDDTPLPSMLVGDATAQCIAVSNGLLELDTLFSGVETHADCLRAHTPAWFSTSAMDYPFEPEAGCPLWLDTLAQIMQGDSERISRIQEWFGYSLVAGNEFKKVLLLHGERDTGKSTILNVFCDFLGRHNICGVPFEDLGHRFALSAMEGKLASVTFEIADGSKAAEGRLKTLSGGDAFVQFERKGKDSYLGRPTCKLVFATNNLPRIMDGSSATLNRFLLVPCLRRFRGAEIDRRLRERLQQELPGILNWALVGRYRLLKQGCFSNSSVCMKAVAEYGEECNPHERFLRSCVLVNASGAIYASDLYRRYKAWMAEHSFQPKNEANFGRVIRQVFPHVTRQREGSGMRPRFYTGLEYGATDDLSVEPDFVPAVAAPPGLLGELWERFATPKPLLLPGATTSPEVQPATVEGEDHLQSIFPTLGQEFRERVERGAQLAAELEQARKLRIEYQRSLAELVRRSNSPPPRQTETLHPDLAAELREVRKIKAELLGDLQDKRCRKKSALKKELEMLEQQTADEQQFPIAENDAESTEMDVDQDLLDLIEKLAEPE